MSKKSIIILIVLILLAVGLYYFFFYNKNNTTVVQSEAVNPVEIQSNFVATLLQLRSLTMETRVLKSPTFNSLVPSGAFINLNPDRGVEDLFAPRNVSPSTQSKSDVIPRDFTGSSITTTSATIKVSNITSTTATIILGGLEPNILTSVDLSLKGGEMQNISNFNYRASTREYTKVVTGLVPSSSYIANIHDPAGFNDAVASFNTK